MRTPQSETEIGLIWIINAANCTEHYGAVHSCDWQRNSVLQYRKEGWLVVVQITTVQLFFFFFLLLLCFLMKSLLFMGRLCLDSWTPGSASAAQTFRVESVVWEVLNIQVVPTCSAHYIESSGLFHRWGKKKKKGAVFKLVNRKLKVWEPLWKKTKKKKKCDLQKSKSWELNPPQSMNSASL